MYGLHGVGFASELDIQRWHEQGFQFYSEPLMLHDNESAYGLIQSKGGPCGILAVIQAEIFKDLFFFESEGSSSDKSINIKSSSSKLLLPEQLLLRAVLRVLQRAAGSRSIDFVVPTSVNNVGDSFNKSVSLTSSSNNLRVLSCDLTSLEDVTVFQVLETQLIGHLKSSIGCILFLMSLVLTRGVEECKSDMDDPQNTLIGQFGHCNQDLINLLLTGRATSNVIDGEIVLGESNLLIKGVTGACSVGYLTHLEALRYCQGGSLKLGGIWCTSTIEIIEVFTLEPILSQAGLI
eukprot:gene31050-40388_t